MENNSIIIIIKFQTTIRKAKMQKKVKKPIIEFVSSEIGLNVQQAPVIRILSLEKRSEKSILRVEQVNKITNDPFLSILALQKQRHFTSWLSGLRLSKSRSNNNKCTL